MHAAMIAMVGILAGGAAAGQERAFELELVFDAMTARRLIQMGEKAVVSAYYYGEPTPEGQSHADEMGAIWLGSEDLTVEVDDQTVTFRPALDALALQWVAGSPRVNINVFSARLAHDNNLLDCGIFEDDIAVAQAAAPLIECALLDP